MANKGLSLMGTGISHGPDRAIKAATEAISSPLLEDISIDGATGIIINITGSENLSMHETNEAVTLIMEAADDEAEIIFGTVIDNEMGDNIKVTVIATGLNGEDRATTANMKNQEEVKTAELQRKFNGTILDSNLRETPKQFSPVPDDAPPFATGMPSVKGKTIAEKLGFIKFNEEELDRPSYARKEEVERPRIITKDYNLKNEQV
jgi:cell division protein FtsZ